MISFLNTFKRLQREKLISNRVRSSLFSSSTLRPPSMVKLIQGQPVSKCLSDLCRVHKSAFSNRKNPANVTLAVRLRTSSPGGTGSPTPFLSTLVPSYLVPPRQILLEGYIGRLYSTLKKFEHQKQSFQFRNCDEAYAEQRKAISDFSA